MTFDGIAVVTCMTDTEGTLSACAFTVPLSAAGLHSIRPVDSSGHATIASLSPGVVTVWSSRGDGT